MCCFGEALLWMRMSLTGKFEDIVVIRRDDRVLQRVDAGIDGYDRRTSDCGQEEEEKSTEFHHGAQGVYALCALFRRS